MRVRTFSGLVPRRLARAIPATAIALTLFGGGVGLGSYIESVAAQDLAVTNLTRSGAVLDLTATADPAATSEPATSAAVEFDRFVRTELYFGAERPDETEITEEDWQRFLDAVVTPRFPDGLTVLTGFGQFRGADGLIDEETSRVLVLLYPVEARKQANQDIEYIRTEFKEWFEQESVLRVDDRHAALVSF